MKKTLTQKQIADYEQLCRDRNNGRLLTPDGLRFICEANNYDPEAIGQHFLEVLANMSIRGGNKTKIKNWISITLWIRLPIHLILF